MHLLILLVTIAGKTHGDIDKDVQLSLCEESTEDHAKRKYTDKDQSSCSSENGESENIPLVASFEDWKFSENQLLTGKLRQCYGSTYM